MRQAEDDMSFATFPVESYPGGGLEPPEEEEPPNEARILIDPDPAIVKDKFCPPKNSRSTKIPGVFMCSFQLGAS